MAMEYFSKYKKYYEPLKNNSQIVGSAKDLSINVSSRVNGTITNYFNRITESVWLEKGKPFITSNILVSLKNQLTKLSNFISNNLYSACDLSINSLFPKIQQIKDTNEQLDNTIDRINSLNDDLKKVLVELKQTAQYEDTYEYNPKTKKNEKTGQKETEEWKQLTAAKDNINSQIDTLNRKIESLTKLLEEYCIEADQIINSILALDGSLSVSSLSVPTSNENTGNIREVYPDILGLFNYYSENQIGNRSDIYQSLFGNNIALKDQIPIRYNLDVLEAKLDGNPYKEVILDYLNNYGNPNFNIEEFYTNNEGALPEWTSTKYPPNTIFDYRFIEKYDQEAQDAMSIVLDHTIYETMRPFYEDGTLDVSKGVQVRAMIYGSDFLVNFGYGRGKEENKYLWQPNATSFSNLGQQTCHGFASGVLYQSIGDFSEVPLFDEKYNGDILIQTSRLKGTAFSDLFPGVHKVPGAGDYCGSKILTHDQSIYLGSVAAYSGKGGDHVIIPLYETEPIDGKNYYAVAESTGNLGVSLSLWSESEVIHYTSKVTPDALSKVDNLSQTPINFEENYQRYCGN